MKDKAVGAIISMFGWQVGRLPDAGVYSEQETPWRLLV